MIKRRDVLISTAATIAIPFFRPIVGHAKPSGAWHCATQPERNRWITEVGGRDIGRQFPTLNCKTWCRKVVEEASQYGGDRAVTIPPTAPDENGWSWVDNPPTPYVVRLNRTIRQAIPGQVIQMNLGKGKPHTAIVESVSSTVIYLLDCNWSLDQKVQKHWLTWSNLEKTVGSLFSIYEIR